MKGRSSELDAILAEEQALMNEVHDPAEYAAALQRARIRLGSAGWRERLRWSLGLGPPRWMFEAGEGLFQFRESWEDARLRFNDDPGGKYERVDP